MPEDQVPHATLALVQLALASQLGPPGEPQVAVCLLGEVGGWILIRSLRGHSSVEVDRRDRETWRMPPLNMLTKPVMSAGRKVALAVLGSYMMIAMVMVIVRIIQMALAH